MVKDHPKWITTPGYPKRSSGPCNPSFGLYRSINPNPSLSIPLAPFRCTLIAACLDANTVLLSACSCVCAYQARKHLAYEPYMSTCMHTDARVCTGMWTYVREERVIDGKSALPCLCYEYSKQTRHERRIIRSFSMPKSRGKQVHRPPSRPLQVHMLPCEYCGFYCLSMCCMLYDFPHCCRRCSYCCNPLTFCQISYVR